MQALPQKTTDYIAEQFRAYFDRKANRGMNHREARDIIDYLSVSGPAPAPSGSGAIDPTKPHVTGGGGRPRPSQERIEGILNKYAVEEDVALWNTVFDELIEVYKRSHNRKALRVIRMSFELQLKREAVCDKMRITERTFNNYRIAILTAAAICAIRKGCNIDT
jgi:hypothetical protein